MLFGFWTSFQALLPRRSVCVGITVTAGVVITILLSAGYVKRRRRKQRDKVDYKELQRAEAVTITTNSGTVSPFLSGAQLSLGQHLSEQNSEIRDPTAVQKNDKQISEEELYQLGLDAFHAAVSYWEQALSLSENGGVGKIPHLKDVIERVSEVERSLQQTVYVSPALSLQTASVLIPEHQGKEDDEVSISSTDSFLSAEGANQRPDTMQVASDQLPSNVSTTADGLMMSVNQPSGHHAFYEEGIALAQAKAVPYRTLRTSTLHCSSDLDFLAKLSCIRKAFNLLFESEDTRQFISQSGKQLVICLLKASDKAHQMFEEAYDRMIQWVSDQGNWMTMASELQDRGVECISFYDVVLDFVLLDAFSDAENPPAAVTAVLNNRWLTQGFKESAFGTAVWSVIKAKSRMVKVLYKSNGI